ncbi:hypothetical protein [Flavobacterium sp.]|uniref:hypothetical protein n=1 Tax=Flavobacterium sp. TaxID=239 RepID=UPI00286A7E17|nr:hypothetical protein [Flavobacterium sp.]
MKIYDSTGTFNGTNKDFNLAVQLTDIAPDTYKITACYDISDVNRYAIVAILQTVDGNKNDLSTYPTNFTFVVNNVKFSTLNKSYLKTGDKDIYKAKEGDTINVIVHHGIGFNPITNPDDDLYIKNYKAKTYVHQPKGSPPGARGTGVLT